MTITRKTKFNLKQFSKINTTRKGSTMQNLEEQYENLYEFIKNFEILIQKMFLMVNPLTLLIFLEMKLWHYANQSDSTFHQTTYYPLTLSMNSLSRPQILQKVIWYLRLKIFMLILLNLPKRNFIKPTIHFVSSFYFSKVK